MCNPDQRSSPAIRNKKAALRFEKKAMRKHTLPEVVLTDRLRSHGAALKELGAGNRQETDLCAE